MLPVFTYGLDHGRWVALCLNSALIMTIESTGPTRKILASARPFSQVAHPQGLANSSPFLSWIVPLGFGFWGLPHGSWTDWFVTSPFGTVLTRLGVPGPLRMLQSVLQVF